MAPQKPKIPVNSIHIDLKPPEPMDYLHAYIRDVERHALGTGGLAPLHPDVCAGIYYVDGGEIVRKIFVPVAMPPSDTAPAQSTSSYESFPGGGFTFSHAPAGSWNARAVDLRREVAAHSAFQGPHVETPIPGPPADYRTDSEFFVPRRGLDDQGRTSVLYMGRLAELPSPTGRPFHYSYSARLALFPDNSPDPVSAVADGRPKTVIYDLELDTGGLADSWVFGNLLWQFFRRVDPDAKYPDARVQAEFARKMKMPFPKYEETPADISRLRYGLIATRLHTVLVKSARCGIAFAHWKPPLRIANFTIGAVYGASDSETMSAFDGLLGLGRGGAVSRSRVKANGRYGLGMTLPEAAWRQGLVETRDFWISIADPTWDEKPDQNFMCLGEFHNPFNKRVPTWLDLDCDPLNSDWMVTLTKITVYDAEDRRRPRRNLLDHDFELMQVLVDSGSTQSYMPGDFVTAVEEMFQTEFEVPRGSASYACPKSLVVCFHFMSGGQVRAIEGQAVRFFISPNYVDADHPALSVKQADREIFGLNFFRTFVIGFRDDDSNPKLTIGKHRNVTDDREPRLACRKGPSDREREAAASINTRPAPGPNRGARDPPPAGETGRRGNSNPSRLRKPSVSAPAKDTRGDGKGHRRTQSEQVPFPPYRPPLPGEDEGQGSSRRRGSNAPVPQEAAYDRRTGRRPSGPYAPAAPAQFQQPANAGGAGWNPQPAQRTRGNSLSYGAPRAGPPPAQPVPAAQQQWAPPGAMYPPGGGAPLQRTTSQPLAPIAGSRRPRPPALPIPVPQPVAPPQTSTRQPRPRTSSLTTGLKNLFGIGGKKPGKR